jgi:hypothetical protein
MPEHALPLEAWANFYVIVGSSAGGLTGLTFVVIALVADAHAVRLTGLRAFITPTIVHFGSALVLSALMNVPGQSVTSLGICLGAFGLGGLIYSGGTARQVNRATTNTSYKPVAEDWIWNAILPTLTYAVLFIAGLIASVHMPTALYLAAAASMVLLIIGIHNAWDIAVWFTAERPGAQAQEDKKPPPSEPPAQ